MLHRINVKHYAVWIRNVPSGYRDWFWVRPIHPSAPVDCLLIYLISFWLDFIISVECTCFTFLTLVNSNEYEAATLSKSKCGQWNGLHQSSTLHHQWLEGKEACVTLCYTRQRFHMRVYHRKHMAPLTANQAQMFHENIKRLLLAYSFYPQQLRGV